MSRIAAILPAGKLFDRVFEEGLLPAAREMASEIYRVATEFSVPPASRTTLWEEIERSTLVIADITARDPHVMFLAGWAIGARKKIIFIAQDGEGFPMGDVEFPPIIYADDPEFLKNELLSYLCGRPRTGPPKEETPRAKFLSTFGDLMKKHQQEHHGEIQMETPKTFVLVNQDLDLALVQDLARRGRELGVRIKLM